MNPDRPRKIYMIISNSEIDPIEVGEKFALSGYVVDQIAINVKGDHISIFGSKYNGPSELLAEYHAVPYIIPHVEGV